VGWGGRLGDKQYSTAGWLAAFPVFEPMYQVVMAHGLASGWVEWRGERREFRDAPCYTEKNWGGAFPRRWWWVQCNAFEARGLTLTCACGERSNPLLELLLPGRTEDACMVALHDESGKFYPFPNCEWDVEWGRWTVRGALDDLRVRVEATCDGEAASLVRCPASDGMTASARERFDGSLSVRVWRVTAREEEEEVLIDSTSSRAAVEVGGEGWEGGGRWKGSCEVAGAARAILSADVPLERFREAIPGL